MKKILFVSHCILNTAEKVKRFQAEKIAAEERLRKAFLQAAIADDVQLVQLPCPELVQYGLARWGHTYEQFDTPFFRRHCEALLAPVVA